MPNLTVKQKKFVKEYLENEGNGTQAALAVYDMEDYNTAHAIASENLQKPTIQRAVQQKLERKGISIDEVLENIKANMEAGMGVKATAKDSLRASDMLLKAAGVYQQAKKPNQHLEINYNFNEMTKEELLAAGIKTTSSAIPFLSTLVIRELKSLA